MEKNTWEFMSCASVGLWCERAHQHILCEMCNSILRFSPGFQNHKTSNNTELPGLWCIMFDTCFKPDKDHSDFMKQGVHTLYTVGYNNTRQKPSDKTHSNPYCISKPEGLWKSEKKDQSLTLHCDDQRFYCETEAFHPPWIVLGFVQHVSETVIQHL